MRAVLTECAVVVEMLREKSFDLGVGIGTLNSTAFQFKADFRRSKGGV